jgi:hypothetical protein
LVAGGEAAVEDLAAEPVGELALQREAANPGELVAAVVGHRGHPCLPVHSY